MTTKPEVPILTAEMAQLVDCFWPEEQAALDAIANGTAKVVSAERLAELEAELASLRAQVKALEADAGRLAWLDAQCIDGAHVEVWCKETADGLQTKAHIYFGAPQMWMTGATVREAIDAAMKEKP
jgi:hypothetical protein